MINQIESTKKGNVPVFRDFKNGIIGYLKNKGIRNNLRHYIKNPPGGISLVNLCTSCLDKEAFNIADLITAAHYSFETLPRYLFDSVTKCKLPMGCHNWKGMIVIFG